MNELEKELSFFAKAAPLLLVLFIDGMGLGLVFPILNGLIFDPHSGFLSETAQTPFMHYVIYGGIVGIFMLCWFFGAAVLGDLSDKVGRKKCLVICLIGAFLSYLVSAVAVIFNSLFLLIIGRIISGLTAGSQPIAQAAIIDISHEDHKTRNIGYILLVLSLGFVFGPLLGGVLADSDIVSWFTFATPFYFASIISFINIILLLVFFKETFVSQNTTFRINPYQAINIFVSAFKDEKIRSLSVIFAIFVFGWGSFYSFIALYLLKIFNFTPTQVSLYMAVMGIGFGVGNGYLSNFLAKRFELKSNFIYCTLLTAIMAFAMIAFENNVFNWLIIAPLAAVVSCSYASILTMFSNQVDANSQGWVMGVTGSVMAFTFGLNGLVVGLIAAFSAVFPLYLSAICLFLSVVAMGMAFKIRA
jgi:DHA1 family tetracycline resistance protein-like MFS transporter